MNKKSKKTFSKKELFSLFESGNYQKVISKIKQFNVEDTTHEERESILLDSYQKLAHEHFEAGDISRAIRDINSLLQINTSQIYEIIKLKYLCYMEYFEDAIVLGERLILSNDKKIKQEAIFLHQLALLYNGNYSLDSTLLKLLPKSQQNYILGFAALLQGDGMLALKYFETSNPRAKIEKNNLEALKIIIKGEGSKGDFSNIKPLYRFLLSGEERGLANTKNIRVAKEEVKREFVNQNKNRAMEDLLLLQEAIDVKIIIQNVTDKEQKTSLIYNNISLLVEKQKNNQALHLFIQYKEDLIRLVESATLFIIIKSHTQDKKSDRALITFLLGYLKLHHQKIAPFQIDFILLFLLNYDESQAIHLARTYNREHFLFWVKELPMANTYSSSLQEKFDAATKRYSMVSNQLIDSISDSLELIDEEIEQFNNQKREDFVQHLGVLMRLLQNSDKVHRKYQESFLNLLKVLASVVQTFPYVKDPQLYEALFDAIEYFVDFFGINKVKLPLDIKAFFISFSKKESIKRRTNHRKRKNIFDFIDMILDEEYLERFRYDFKEEEYDALAIKNQCIENLEKAKEHPFSPLATLKEYYYKSYVHHLVLDLIAKSIELKIDNTDKVIHEIISTLAISFCDTAIQAQLIQSIKQYAKNDPKVALVFLEYAIGSVEYSRRGYVWYLKWLESYIVLFIDHRLEQNSLFNDILNEFLKIQKKKKFKSMSASYDKFLKLNSSQQGVLF